MRQLYGIATSLITAILIIFIAQFIREGLFPYPTGLDVRDKAAMIAWTRALPLKAYMILAFSHALAVFAASFITSLTVGKKNMTLGVISMSIIIVVVTIYSWIYHFSFSYIAIDTSIMIMIGFVGALTGSNRYDI